MNRTTLAAIGLAALGLAQIAGDLLRIPPLKGVAAATAASPAPKVFSAVRGLETYSTRFFIEWDAADAEQVSIELTPVLYERLRGPYVRRNVYGAALAYGPVLDADDRTRPMLHAVLTYALSGERRLLRELGIDDTGRVSPVRIRYQPLEGARLDELPLHLEAPR